MGSGELVRGLGGKGSSYSPCLPLLESLRLQEHLPHLHANWLPVSLLQLHELQGAPLKVAIFASRFYHLAAVDKGTNYLCGMYQTQGLWVLSNTNGIQATHVNLNFIEGTLTRQTETGGISFDNIFFNPIYPKYNHINMRSILRNY